MIGPRRRRRSSNRAPLPFLAIITGVLLVTVGIGYEALDHFAEADLQREAARWEEFQRRGCPGDLSDDAKPRQRCEWEARKQRCTSHDVCWYRCTVQGKGRGISGGCAHLCNASFRWDMAPLAYSPECRALAPGR